MVTERTLCPILVGRQHELAPLDDALLDAARGDGRLVVFAGEAGIGKSRLATETRRRATRLGFTVLRGGCAATGLAIPYLPFLEAINNELARADVARVRERLEPGLERELASLFPKLFPDPGRRVDQSRDGDKLGLFEAIVSLLSALAEGRPLLLVIEDLHWADPSTRELADYLAHRVSSLPMVLVATFRSDELLRRDPLLLMVHGWRRGGLAEVLELTLLTALDVAQMSQAILGNEVSDEFRDYLFDRTEGSPLAIEEMLREGVDRGDIFRSERGWDRKPIARLRLPRAVSEVILLRADRLATTESSVLDAAAVIGRSFTYTVLAAITNLAEDDVSRAVEELVLHQFLEPDLEVRGRFRFRHALIQEAVYDQIISPRRERLHLRTAEALGQAAAPALEIGNHLLLAGQTASAVPLLLRAAEEAMSNYAAASAVELYERLMPHVNVPEQRGRLLERLGEALWRSGQPLAAERHLRQAAETLTAVDEPAGAARCRQLIGACLHDQGRIREEELEYQRALSILEALPPNEDQAMVHLRLARLRWSRCDNRGAKAMAERTIAVADAAGADLVGVWARAYLGAATAHLGEVDEGFRLLESSWRDATEKRMYWAAAAVLRLDMSVRNHALRNPEIPALMQTFRSLPGISPADEIVARCLEATVAFDACELADCRRHLEAASTLVNRTGHRLLLEEVRVLGGAVHLAADELAEARSELPPPAEASPAAIEWLLPLGVILELAGHNPRAAAEVADAGLRAAGEEVEAVVSEAAVEAFLSVGRLGDARGLVDHGRHFRGPGRDAYLQRARARLAIAESRAADALPLLAGLCGAFADAGERWEELRTRLLLARASTATGRLAEVADQLSRVETEAERRGVALLVRHARELRAELGITEAPAPAGAFMAPLEAQFEAALSGPIVSAAGPAQARELWEWAAKETRRCHGVCLSLSVPFTATFDRTTADEGWVDALRLAVGLRDKARLLDAPVTVEMAPASGATPITAAAASAPGTAAAAQAIVIRGGAPQSARDWLRERGLHADLADGETLVVPQRWVAGPGDVHHAAADLRPSPPPPANVFVQEGEFWSVSFAGLTVRLKDVKGMRDIARLLGARGTELAAVELIGVSPGRSAQRPADLASIDMAQEGDAGEVIDHEARQQYRARLADLEEDLEEATSANDIERAARIREERSFLLSELAGAVGLHGKARRALDPAERARKAVTWRIRDAIDRADTAHPQLGRHLRHSVRTGTFCAYDPPEPTQWVLARPAPRG